MGPTTYPTTAAANLKVGDVVMLCRPDPVYPMTLLQEPFVVKKIWQSGYTVHVAVKGPELWQYQNMIWDHNQPIAYHTLAE